MRTLLVTSHHERCDSLGVDLVALQNGADSPLAHDGDARAEAEDFIHVRADQKDGDAGLGQGVQEPVDFCFGGDVDAAGGFVDDKDA